MHRDELVIVLFTVVIMAEAKVCYRYQRLVNGHFRWAIAPDDDTQLCTSYLLGGVSLQPSKSLIGQDTATEGTRTNDNTPPSSSQEAQRDSTTDVSPSTSETIENAPRCNFFFAKKENYSMAKTTCLEIGGKIFGFEHLQANKTSSETFRDLMSTHDDSSSCYHVWVDIIRNDENQFEWSEGPVFERSDSWWGNNQPNDYGSSESCVASLREDNWKLHDVRCIYSFCTMCMDAWCNSH